jgi:S1-C subfamily serine protease
MKSRSRGIAVALSVLLAGVAGAGIALGLASAFGGLSTTTIVNRNVATPTSLQTSATTSGQALSASAIYKRTASGVVQITTKSIVMEQTNPFFPAQSQTQEALGSGFVIDKQGDIVTNYHVVEGANSIEVLFSNHVTTKATIVGTDKKSDLAVLKVNVSPSALTPLSFGDSSTVQVGDPVVAIGNPFGLDRTVTSGIVSAIYNLGDGATSNPLASLSSGSSTPLAVSLIQTDAAINHGNSGGPLINDLGQVVGVNTAIETGNTTNGGNVGIGFAIQSNTVKEVVAKILETGKATHPVLGILFEEVTPEVASLYRLPVQEGLLVVNVQPRTGAAKAGLKAGTRTVTVSGVGYKIGGDIIVKADGVNVGSSGVKFDTVIAAHKPGDKIALEIYRGNTQMTVMVTLGNRS